MNVITKQPFEADEESSRGKAEEEWAAEEALPEAV